MKAMILAAGRGERMRPLTDTLHKGLICINAYTLIEKHLYSLAKIGVTEVVINISHLADQIRTALGNGERYHLKIIYSFEEEALETAGGIIHALPFLGNDPFILISCDIYTDFPFETLYDKIKLNLGHLILVDNPSYHPHGDYGLENNYLNLNTHTRYTYASMGILHPHLFNGWQPGKRRLTAVLEQAILQKKLTGEIYRGMWFNIGTEKDLDELIKLVV